MHGLVLDNCLTASIWNIICLMKRWNRKIKGIFHENGIKVKKIRNYYSAERCKEAASKNSGSRRDDLYTSKWLFFQLLLFLRNNWIPQVTETNLIWPQMETIQNPREGKIACPVLGKMSIQEKNNTINTCFCINWANLTNVLMPLTSTNPSISI